MANALRETIIKELAAHRLHHSDAPCTEACKENDGTVADHILALLAAEAIDGLLAEIEALQNSTLAYEGQRSAAMAQRDSAIAHLLDEHGCHCKEFRA